MNWYGISDLNTKNLNTQIIKCTTASSETLFTKKDNKDVQNSFPYLEKQKYKHDNNFSISDAELFFIVFDFKKNDFYFQEVADNYLIPRSPPQNLS